jgi:hypothetical protein
MAFFKDNGGNEWPVDFDAFLLDDTRKETGIDLADISSGGWLQVETDSVALGRVMASICRAEIKSRHLTAQDFAKRLRGAVIEAAREALRNEAADFFPPSEWSAIRSNLTKRTEAMQDANNMKAQMAAIEAMGPEFRQGAMAMFLKSIETGDTSLSSLMDGQFVSGPDATPSVNAIDGPENAESRPED